MSDVGAMSEDGTLTLLLRNIAGLPFQQQGKGVEHRPTALSTLLRGFNMFTRRQRISSELTLASITTVLVWTQAAYDRCRELQSQFHHQCALENRSKQEADNKHYASAALISKGFYKVGAIVNSVSLGVDTVFLDSDTVVLRNFLPYIQSLQGADIATSTEKCIIRDYSRPYERVELSAGSSNIGLVYMRAVPGNVRCGTSWMAKMSHDVALTGKAWDQVAFNAVYPDCYSLYKMVWYGLDPRYFQLGCSWAGFKQCGCTFSDSDVAAVGPAPARGERLSKQFLPFSSPGVCGPADWKDWYTKHYNCILGVNGSSPQAVKATYMRNLVNAVHSNQPGHIMPHN